MSRARQACLKSSIICDVCRKGPSDFLTGGIG